MKEAKEMAQPTYEYYAQPVDVSNTTKTEAWEPWQHQASTWLMLCSLGFCHWVLEVALRL